MNLPSWRADTPACEKQFHFNNAGASLMPLPVQQAIHNHIQLEADRGGYEAADIAETDVEAFYGSMDKLLNCGASNIAFTSSATNSFARALSCIPFKQGDKILITNEDYISNQLAFLSIKKRFGIDVIRATSLPEGGVDIVDLKRLMRLHKPILVSVTHVPTNSGLVQPIEEIGKLCKEFEITYLVDACQSVGQLPLDVNKIQCDFLSGTFRKFLRGPRGAGFLFVSDRILKLGWEPLFIDMRGAVWTSANAYEQDKTAKRFEDWEIPYALLLGSKTAVDYSLNIGLKTIQERNAFLAESLRSQLSSIGLHSLDLGKNPCAIVTVYHKTWNLNQLKVHLQSHKVNFSISQGDYAVIDFATKQVPWALRLSPHYFNTEEEIKNVIEILKNFR